ncbi:hypothetical protein AYM40_26765 [Paraburkholderia phytofirmans OLGA172]|uniref:AB hydrolase-1 domain-containing protein n=1 Tax=Paraburkholderia phytofirmans OLGA172 TaxID=1417228 RepID=A0A160FSN6_9BURK|nr:alpha/beta hydrolase [Paraburkholderia phytofirmans]ANB75902.1 hypothetical protein AYM40_26765 [Paraburkholderia phytofirmans OLGA172]
MQPNRSHENAVTQFVDGKNAKYAYRIIGPQDGVPLVFVHRFRGTIDEWDPAVVNGFAKERRVVLFDNTGVGLSSGDVATSVQQMAENAVDFIAAMHFDKVDLLGFSMGGYIAQTVALTYPSLVEHLILAGTGPGGGEGVVPMAAEVRQVAGREVLGLDEFMHLFFTKSEASQEAGKRYWQRLQLRPGPKEPALSQEGVKAQATALMGMAQGVNAPLPRLGEIKIPVLVANGSNDIMVPTPNSFLMSQKLPNAQLILYPDSGHGFLFQYPELFVEHGLTFLRS